MFHVFKPLAILFAALSLSTAHADERFEDAVALWLNGNDAQSLPMFAGLASEGHTDARLLLARIEKTDLGPSPFRLSLTADQSRALFRQSNGSRFGRSWLAVEADAGNTLASALLGLGNPNPDLDLITRLHSLGEAEATDHPSRILALYADEKTKRDLQHSGLLMPDLEPYLAYLSGPPEPRGDGLAALRHILPNRTSEVSASNTDALGMAGLLALGTGFGDHRAANPWRRDVENWLLTAPATRPIAGLCNQRCSADVGPCAFAFLSVSGGYYEAIRFDSPLETVIPQARYVTSERARLSVLRRAVNARTETNLDWLSDDPSVSEISQCAADIIADERAKYP